MGNVTSPKINPPLTQPRNNVRVAFPCVLSHKAKCFRRNKMWRKRVGVEPTPESAKDTGHGFEDHEDHRTPFASANSIADAMNGTRRAAGTEGRGQGLACKKDLWAGQRQAGSGTLGSHDGSLLGADQGGDEVVERGAGADFVIGMRSRSADFSVREQLPGETFAQNEQFDGLPQRHFPVI